METTALEHSDIEYLIGMCEYVLSVTEKPELRFKIIAIKDKLTEMLEPAQPEAMKPLTSSLTETHPGFVCKTCGSIYGNRPALRKHARYAHRDYVK